MDIFSYAHNNSILTHLNVIYHPHNVLRGVHKRLCCDVKLLYENNFDKPKDITL